MPYYDFYCEECEILAEDEFFRIADEKIVKCIECENQMQQVILKAPGLRDPGGIGRKWTNDGYQLQEEKSGNLRTIKEKWEKGKNVIRDDVHKDDPPRTFATVQKNVNKLEVKRIKNFYAKLKKRGR